MSQDEANWEHAWKALLWVFAAAGVYSLIASQVPGLSRFPVFTWIGLSSATAWGWELAPSLGYVGQVSLPLLPLPCQTEVPKDKVFAETNFGATGDDHGPALGSQHALRQHHR